MFSESGSTSCSIVFIHGVDSVESDVTLIVSEDDKNKMRALGEANKVINRLGHDRLHPSHPWTLPVLLLISLILFIAIFAWMGR